MIVLVIKYDQILYVFFYSYLPLKILFTSSKIIYRRGGRSSAGRAPDCGSGGRGFKPHRSPHFAFYIPNLYNFRAGYIITIMCPVREIAHIGHLKSSMYFMLLAWSLGARFALRGGSLCTGVLASFCRGSPRFAGFLLRFAGVLLRLRGGLASLCGGVLASLWGGRFALRGARFAWDCFGFHFWGLVYAFFMSYLFGGIVLILLLAITALAVLIYMQLRLHGNSKLLIIPIHIFSNAKF